MTLYPVPAGAEWRRVDELPRRVWRREDAAALAETWSPLLLNEYGLDMWNHCARLSPAQREAEIKRLAERGFLIRLKADQAMILHEFVANRGVFVAAPVGAGKTLIAYLATLLAQIHFGIQRPVLLLPSSLVEDGLIWHTRYSQVWQMPRPMPKFESFEVLGQPQNEFLLCTCRKCTGGEEVPEGLVPLQPDFIPIDECSKLRNPDAAVSARVGRYIANHLPICLPMTGTPVRKSIRNFNRALVWALTREFADRVHHGAPVPYAYKDLEEWCGATDEKPREGRRPPGALLRWAPPDCKTELEAARRGLQNRMAETPGVVIIDQMSCTKPLTIRPIEIPDDPAITEAFRQFRLTDSTLDDHVMGDPFSVLRYGIELGCGFYSRWNPRPPQWYLDARTAWKRHVKARIERSQRGGRPIDQEGVVARLDRDTPVYLAWKAAQEKFGKPNSEAVAIMHSTISYAARWIKNNGPGLVWVQHTWVGEVLSRMSGVPYFAGKGKTSGGVNIRDYPATKSAILSTHANSYGRNLQAWSVNLVVAPEFSAEKWEQQMGRTHRYGQEHSVHYDVLVTSAESLQALDRAVSEAHNAEQMWGLQQKLLTATWDWSYVTEAARHPEMIVDDDARAMRWTPHQLTPREK